MLKYCPKCETEREGNFFCSECGGKLVDMPKQDTLGVNLGDANVVYGGINMSDSHNVDSHDVYHSTQNVYHTIQERQKTVEELRSENERKFREEVRKALEDGELTGSEIDAIARLAEELGIASSRKSEIVEAEYGLIGRRMRSGELSDDQKDIIQAVQISIMDNNISSIRVLFPRLKMVNEDTENGQVQFLYYMLRTFLEPQEFIESAKRNKLVVDCFWRTVWLMVACEREHVIPSDSLRRKYAIALNNADGNGSEEERQYPGNASLARCLVALSQISHIDDQVFRDLKLNSVRKSIELFKTDFQPFLSGIATAVDSIVNGSVCPEKSHFYLKFLKPDVVLPKTKEQEMEDMFPVLKEIPRMPKIDPIPEM